MSRYDTSQTSPDFEPPPRRLGSGVWLGAIIVIALVILGVFIWGAAGTGGSSPSPSEQHATTPAPTTTGQR
jgi:hypothetical protein